METQVTPNCFECGQILKEGKCLRCDEICARCEYPRRQHLMIHANSGVEVCPDTVFKGTGEY